LMVAKWRFGVDVGQPVLASVAKANGWKLWVFSPGSRRPAPNLHHLVANAIKPM